MTADAGADSFSTGLPEPEDLPEEKGKAKRFSADDLLLFEMIEKAKEVPMWDGVSPLPMVTVRHVPEHSYRKVKGKRGCQVDVGGKTCRAAHAAVLHHLPTVNETLTHDHDVYQSALKKWKPWIIEQMIASGLPRGLGSVLVEGHYCFPTRIRNVDQGNHRGFIEKAFGDALQDGGWLERDIWDAYEFGGFSKTYEKGVRYVEFRVMANVLGVPAAAASYEPLTDEEVAQLSLGDS